MESAAKRQIENVHTVGDRSIDSVEDVLAAGVQHAAWEDVVVPQKGARRYPGHVIDAHAVYHRSLAGDSRGIPGGVRPMILDGLGVEALLFGLVEEDLGDNDLWRDVLA